MKPQKRITLKYGSARVDEGYQIINKINKNREEINNFLNVDLPLDIIYFNIRRLSASNERLIKELNLSAYTNEADQNQY